MALEAFHQDEKREDNKRFSRPEDELNTSESVELDLQERAFAAQGGLKELRKLKVITDRLSLMDFLISNRSSDYELSVISDPETYARNALGFEYKSGSGPEADEKLKLALDGFLKEAQIKRLREISDVIVAITQYEHLVGKEALSRLKAYLETCAMRVRANDWKGFTREAQEGKAYLRGLIDMTTLCCGKGVESGATKRFLGVGDTE